MRLASPRLASLRFARRRRSKIKIGAREFCIGELRKNLNDVDLLAYLGVLFVDSGPKGVSERSERALVKTSILAMNPAKWLQTATPTTTLN